MQKKLIYLALIISLFSGIFGLKNKALAETPNVFFYFEIDKETYFNPDIIAFDLKVESWEAGLNAISFRLDFEPENLTLLNADKNGSICSLIVREEIDNDNGNFRLDCGTFNPVALGPEQVARLTFRKNAAGPTLLSSTGESEALMDDGFGTKLNAVNEDNLVEIIK